MSSSQISLPRLALVGALLVSAGAAHAQYGRKPQKQPELPPGRVSGEIKSVGNGAIMVSDGTQTYWVRVAPNAQKIDVTGEGDVATVQPRMFVRFDIKMDKQGNGKEDIAKIELFTPNAETAPTGVRSNGDDGQYTVAGIVKSLTKVGKLTVEAPGDKPGEKITVKAQLAKDATVDIGVRGGTWLRLAKAGDGATASGRVAKPSAPKSPGLLIADEIEVKLVKQISAEPEKPEPKTKAPAKKAKEKAAKEKADNEKADNEKADNEKADNEKAEEKQ